MEPAGESGLWRCARCGSEAAFEGNSPVSLNIPRYEARLRDLEQRVREVTKEIEVEGARGEERDMPRMGSLHRERQRLLSEFAFFSHFREMVEKHGKS